MAHITVHQKIQKISIIVNGQTFRIGPTTTNIKTGLDCPAISQLANHNSRKLLYLGIDAIPKKSDIYIHISTI